MTLVLDGPTLTWLGEAGVPAVENDLELTYGFAHHLNARRVKDKLEVRHEAQPYLLWWIRFYERDRDDCILEDGVPLARKVFAKCGLSSGEVGRVAYNATLFLRSEYRRKGFATALYASEAELYQRWGVDEIQMQATRDGLRVWITRFGFEPMVPELVEFAYRNWAATRRTDPDPPERAADYPPEFLSSFQMLDLRKRLG